MNPLTRGILGLITTSLVLTGAVLGVGDASAFATGTSDKTCFASRPIAPKGTTINQGSLPTRSVFRSNMFRSTRFDGITIQNFKFAPQTHFEASCFIDSDLTNSTFAWGNFTDASFTSTTIEGADFSGVDFTGVKSSGLIGTPKALPLNWKLINGTFIGPKANLSDANLSGADLSKSNLAGIRSGRITGPVTLPKGWVLSGGFLWGPTADLSYERLYGIDITGADLQAAILTGVKTNNLIGKPAKLPGGYIFGNGAIFGPSVNLEAVSLKNLDLSKISLAHIVQAGSLYDSPKKLPTGYKLAKGWIVGKDLTLTGSDLSGSDLSGVDFSNSIAIGANFSDTNLTSAKFLQSDLTSSKFEGAILKGADLTGATLKYANFWKADMLNAKVPCRGQMLTLNGLPTALPTCWFIDSGQIYEGQAPQPNALGAIVGAATSDKTGVNSLSYVPSARSWLGVPEPSVTYQWYSCSKPVAEDTRVVPKECSPIGKQTSYAISVLPAYKGKYLALALTASNGIGKPVTVFIQSSPKVK